MPTLESVRKKPAALTMLAREDTSELYVLNNSSHSRRMSAGVVIFNVPITANDTRIVRVPNTWVPVNIGLQVPRAKILDSADFLQALNERALLGILASDAEEIFASDPEARDEWDRVSQNLLGGGTIEEQMGMVNTEMEDAIDPKLNKTIVEAVNRDDITEADLYSIVRNQAEGDLLKDIDYDYILRTSKFDKVNSFISNRRANKK